MLTNTKALYIFKQYILWLLVLTNTDDIRK